MKSYFDKNFKWTQEALEIHEKVLKTLELIFEEETAKGYSPRELSSVLHGTVTDAEVSHVLSRKEFP